MNVKKMFGVCAVFAALAVPVGVMAKDNPMVGGAPMSMQKDIIDNAVNSADHTTLVAAVKAGRTGRDPQGQGPVHRLRADQRGVRQAAGRHGRHPAQAREQVAALTQVLTYHVVAGKVDSTALVKKIKAGNGKATLKTVAGGTLTATMDGSDVVLTDAKGGTSKVTIADVYQSNGVIHVVDSVLLPG